MNRKYFFVGLLFFAFACSSETKTETTSNTKEQPESQMEEKAGQVLDAKNPRIQGGAKLESQNLIEEAQAKIATASSKLLGYWIGKFGKGTINISLSEIDENQVKGHSICFGNFRPVTGTITKLNENEFELNLKEPGDDKYDGEFVLKINTVEDTLTGNWKPFKKSSTSEKDFGLKRKSYKYDSSVGDFPEASQRLLTEDDLDHRAPEELELMRNEIYARHGYSFRNALMRTYFSNKDWYMPMGVDVREKLTDNEVKNIQLIKNYEEYFDEYYDDFGR